jgi:hypothetical protein
MLRVWCTVNVRVYKSTPMVPTCRLGDGEVCQGSSRRFDGLTDTDISFINSSSSRGSSQCHHAASSPLRSGSLTAAACAASLDADRVGSEGPERPGASGLTVARASRLRLLRAGPGRRGVASCACSVGDGRARNNRNTD